MNCPACSAVLGADAKDCPGCGVNIAAWKNRSPAPAPSAPRAARQQAFPFAATAGVVIAAGCIGFWFLRPKSVAEKAVETAPAAAIAAPREAEAAAPAPPAGPSKDGYNQVLSEYSARAGMYGPSQEAEAKRFYDVGVDEVKAIGFDAMEEAGYTLPEEPFTAEEKKTASGAAARCMGPNGMVYLPALPADDKTYSSCWVRPGRRAKSTREFIVISSPVFPGYAWVRAMYGPGGWSPWSLDQRLNGARSYVEKYYGMAQQERDRQMSEQQIAELEKRGGSAADKNNALFIAFRSRFRREGALASIELMSR